MYNYTVTTDDMGIEFMKTDNWQTAIDTWSETVAACSMTRVIQINVLKDDIPVQTLVDKTGIQKHSEYLMFLESNKENRVTKRLVQQEYDGMEVVEPKDMTTDEYLTDRYGYYTTSTQERYSDMIKAAAKLDDMEAEHIMSQSLAMAEEIEEELDEALAMLNAPVDFHGDFANMTWDQQDDIINPKHYKMIPKEAYEKHPDGLEYMDLMEYILAHHNGVESHLLGQVFKYAMRLGKKDADLQDARKIEWYATRLVNVIEERS